MNDNPYAIFEIDGHRWDSILHPGLFQRVSVDLATGEASQALWQCLDPHFQIIDKYAGVASGAGTLPVIRAWLGYGDNLGEPVFKGMLARVERGETSTTFRAYDMSYRMRRVKKTRYLKGTNLEIIARLAKENELQFEGPEKPLKLEPHKSMPQDEQTDWEQVSERAHDDGLVLFTRGDTLFAKYPAKVGAPKLTLTYKKDFTILRNFSLAFKVPENVGGRPRQVKVHGRARGGRRLTGESDQSSRGTEQLSIKQDLPIHSKAHATARAQAQKELDREHAFTISISQLFSSLPATRCDVRDTVRLQAIGKLFSGDNLADRVSHEFSPGHLTTNYELYRDVKEQ